MRFDNINEGVAKIACTKCDEVSTAKAWEKNNGFCPKCKTSSQGVAESEDTRMGTITVTSDEERKRRAKAYRDKKLKEADGEGTYARVSYEYSEDWGSIDLYKNHNKVAEWDGYFGANETGNPLARKFVEMCKEHGFDPMKLQLVDENGDIGKFNGKTFKWEDSVTEVSTEKLRDYASAALQDKNKAKADKRWKYAGKAMQTVADREVKAAHDRKYNKMEEVDLDEAAKTNLDDYYMDVAKAFKKENPKLKLSGLGWTKKGMIAVKDMNGDEWEYNPRTRKLTLMTEAVNRDEYAGKLAAQQKDKFFAAALAALDRLVKSDPRGQDVGGYAFDIARAFNGINGKELVRAYNEIQ